MRVKPVTRGLSHRIPGLTGELPVKPERQHIEICRGAVPVQGVIFHSGHGRPMARGAFRRGRLLANGSFRVVRVAGLGRASRRRLRPVPKLPITQGFI